MVEEEIGRIKKLEDIFFQNEDYVSYSSVEFPYGFYRQIPLTIDSVIKRIGFSRLSNLKYSYDIAVDRIARIIGRKFALALDNYKDSKQSIEYYISKDIGEIHYYVARIIEIRNAIIGLDESKTSFEIKERNFSFIFGNFDEIVFLTQIFYSFIPQKYIENKKLKSLLDEIIELYKEHPLINRGKVR